MRNFWLLLHGISLGLPRHIFPKEFLAIEQNVITANVKIFLPFLTYVMLGVFKDF